MGENRLFVRRDGEPADEDDLVFIARAPEMLQTLLRALEQGTSIPREQLDGMEAVASRATPGPWTSFIEEAQPIGGCSMIWVDGDNDVSDMYLWLGDDIAPASDIEFVAHAREDVPQLIAALRESAA